MDEKRNHCKKNWILGKERKNHSKKNRKPGKKKRENCGIKKTLVKREDT